MKCLLPQGENLSEGSAVRKVPIFKVGLFNIESWHTVVAKSEVSYLYICTIFALVAPHVRLSHQNSRCVVKFFYGQSCFVKSQTTAFLGLWVLFKIEREGRRKINKGPLPHN